MVTIICFTLCMWLGYLCQGGDEIDDVFGCTTTSNGTIVADTYNVAGGDRSNVGDNSGMVSIPGIYKLHIEKLLIGGNHST